MGIKQKIVNVLRRLRITRVDFVDEPANPGARIALFKRKDEDVAQALATVTAAITEHRPATITKAKERNGMGSVERVLGMLGQHGRQGEDTRLGGEMIRHGITVDMNAVSKNASGATYADVETVLHALTGPDRDLSAVLKDYPTLAARWGTREADWPENRQPSLAETAAQKLDDLARANAVAKDRWHDQSDYFKAYEELLRTDRGRALYALTRHPEANKLTPEEFEKRYGGKVTVTENDGPATWIRKARMHD